MRKEIRGGEKDLIVVEKSLRSITVYRVVVYGFNEKHVEGDKGGRGGGSKYPGVLEISLVE